MALIVARHCVADSGRHGLSPLQEALLTNPRRVRIADAPTGAGKSFAFQQAVLDGERVLFIVPTRRLAQNLAAGLARDLVGRGWSPEQAGNKIEIWSSDRTAQLREQGVLRIGGHRIRQIQGLDDTRPGGEMIVAIPEVLSHLLLQRKMEAGHAAAGIFEVLDFFDHVVFDEFHTIEARGFGLAALCARLASAENPDGSRFGRARVSFLSATPLDVRPVLERLGVPGAEVAQLREHLEDQGRPVHGDVTLDFLDRPSLAELVAEKRNVIVGEIEIGNQAVIIYDRLGDLVRELPDLVRTLEQAGVPAERMLVINSIADSGPDGIHRSGCRVGRWQNPDRFSVLIATSSIEIGVTFRDANLMLMEPGFGPMNFLQRYGRAARRGRDGQVFVRYEKALKGRHPWLRELIEWADAQAGQRISIGDLTDRLSASTRKAFRDAGEDDARYFGALPNRAVYTAGLYWNALMRHGSNRGPRYEHLKTYRPPSAGTIFGLLRAIRDMEQDRQFGGCAKRWCDRFEEQAYVLRDIGQRLRVVQGSGTAIEVDVALLERETTILDSLPVEDGPQGKPEVRLSGDLEDYLRDQRRPARRMVTVYFPHTDQNDQLPAGNGLVDAWCRRLRKRTGFESAAWEDYPEAMAAAEKLIRLTGLVPGDDDSISLAASSIVL